MPLLSTDAFRAAIADEFGLKVDEVRPWTHVTDDLQLDALELHRLELLLASLGAIPEEGCEQLTIGAIYQRFALAVMPPVVICDSYPSVAR
jgi:hypothetical protein